MRKSLLFTVAVATAVAGSSLPIHTTMGSQCNTSLSNSGCVISSGNSNCQNSVQCCFSHMGVCFGNDIWSNFPVIVVPGCDGSDTASGLCGIVNTASCNGQECIPQVQVAEGNTAAGVSPGTEMADVESVGSDVQAAESVPTVIPELQTSASQKSCAINDILGSQKSCAGNSILGSQESCTGNSILGSQKSCAGNSILGSQESCTSNSILGTQKSCTINDILGNQKSCSNSIFGTQKSNTANSVLGSQESCADKNGCSSQKSCTENDILGSQKSCLNNSICGTQKSCTGKQSQTNTADSKKSCTNWSIEDILGSQKSCTNRQIVIQYGTQKSCTNNQNATEQETKKQGTTKPDTTKPGRTEQATTKPGTTEQATTNQNPTKYNPTEQTTTKQSTTRPDTDSSNNREEVTKSTNTSSNDTQSLSYVQQVVKLVNQERVKAGLKEVTFDSQIASAASIRAREIEQSFSHTRPNGSSFSSVLKEQGISFRGAGENIAWGQKSPEEVMNGWMNSEGHRANILNPNFTKIGVGYYQNASGRKYWTQLFTY